MNLVTAISSRTYWRMWQQLKACIFVEGIEWFTCQTPPPPSHTQKQKKKHVLCPEWGTVKPVLRDHLSWQTTHFIRRTYTFQYNWTCPQRPPVLTDHIFVASGVVFQDRFHRTTKPYIWIAHVVVVLYHRCTLIYVGCLISSSKPYETETFRRYTPCTLHTLTTWQVGVGLSLRTHGFWCMAFPLTKGYFCEAVSWQIGRIILDPRSTV